MKLDIIKRAVQFLLTDYTSAYQKKQPCGGVRKKSSEIFCKIHRKAPLPESLFNKAADCWYAFN